MKYKSKIFNNHRYFFFKEIECSKMQPLWISKNPCITEVMRKLIKWEGGGVGVCAPSFEGLKIISAGKDGGREGVPVLWSHGDKRISEWSGPAIFQFDRERVLGNACYAQSTLWEEFLTLAHQSTCRDSIYSKGKVQRHFFGEPASRGSFIFIYLLFIYLSISGVRSMDAVNAADL